MDYEFPLEDRDFRTIAQLVTAETGIVIDERKRAFIHGRLGRRLRALGLSDFSEYCRVLEDPDHGSELGMLINAITTNHTSFFREPHHFDYLAKTILPHIAKEGGRRGRLRIWSAGCSSGEEPYTLAMTLRDFQPSLADWDARILATDLDTNVLAHGRAGIYDADRVNSIPAAQRQRYVTMLSDRRGEMDPALRSLITFAQVNLLEAWPMHGPFDVIFCRNVVIYFDKPTQRRLFDRYADILRPDGWLVVGHSESLMNLSDRFDAVGRTIYRRIR